MTSTFTESTVEGAALEIFGALGYTILHGPDIAPGELFTERSGYGDVVLLKRLRGALARINPQIPAEAIEEAVRKVLRTESPSLVENNRHFHRFLTGGVPVEYRRHDRIVHDSVRLFDFDAFENNDWATVNQFTIEENRRNRRPGLQSASNLQRRHSQPLPVQRIARYFRRDRSAPRHTDSGLGTLHALADD